MRALNGEVAEWSKAHAWKVCIRQRIEGSNPSLTAILFAVIRDMNFSVSVGETTAIDGRALAVSRVDLWRAGQSLVVLRGQRGCD